MHLSKLITLLQAFDTPRLVRLREFVHSPYFKVNNSSVTLFDYLYKYHPNFTTKRINVEAIGRNNPNLSTASKQAFAGSYLINAIESFFAHEDWRKNKTDMLYHQLRGLKELNLERQFGKEYEKVMEPLNNHPDADIDVFFQKHLFTELSFNGFEARSNRISDTDLTPILRTLDEFYALKKLRYLCEMIDRQRLFGITFNGEDIPALLRVIEPYKSPKYPYVYLFVHVFLMLRADTFEDSVGPYQLLRKYTEEHKGELPQSIIECIAYAISYCLRWYNKGYQDAGTEYLWWIGLKLKHNLLLESGQMMPVTYRNIVSIAVSSRESPEWLERMVKEYSSYLPGEHRPANYSFAKGLYSYSQRDFKSAVRSLLQAQAGEEVIFNSIIRRWQFICLYECDNSDTDALFNHLTSFEKYLSRYQDRLAPVKSVFDKFIHYATELVKAKPRILDEPWLTELQNEDYFAGKHWMLEQFDNLRIKRTSRKHRVALNY